MRHQSTPRSPLSRLRRQPHPLPRPHRLSTLSQLPVPRPQPLPKGPPMLKLLRSERSKRSKRPLQLKLKLTRKPKKPRLLPLLRLLSRRLRKRRRKLRLLLLHRRLLPRPLRHRSPSLNLPRRLRRHHQLKAMYTVVVRPPGSSRTATLVIVDSTTRTAPNSLPCPRLFMTMVLTVARLSESLASTRVRRLTPLLPTHAQLAQIRTATWTCRSEPSILLGLLERVSSPVSDRQTGGCWRNAD